jgi:2-C-methyl-D-erythritol 4-phosphate cytidylyltransferase
VSGEAVDIVAVHDGVRPFVTPNEITRTVQAAGVNGAAILVSSPVDTMKQVSDGLVVKTLKRTELRNALTPQCFRYDLLLRAYQETDVSDPELTDESSLVERLGVKIAIVEGSSRNIKLTRPEDLPIAEALLKSVSSEQ